MRQVQYIELIFIYIYVHICIGLCYKYIYKETNPYIFMYVCMYVYTKQGRSTAQALWPRAVRRTLRQKQGQESEEEEAPRARNKAAQRGGACISSKV
jgi:hypothetical protein